MKGIKIFGYVLLALLFISTVPYAAEAGSVKIYPDQFKPVDPTSPYIFQNPSYLYGDGGAAMYYAVVKLPAGKTVTRLVAYWGCSSGCSSPTNVVLYRCKFGATADPQQMMANVAYSGYTGWGAFASASSSIDHPAVNSDFRYFVQVEVAANHDLFGVKVVYE